MTKKTKWTADDIGGMVACVILLVLAVVCSAGALGALGAFRAALVEKEAKASGQSECAAKHIPAEAPLR